MVVKGNNGKAPACKRQSVAASSSSKSVRSNSVSKSSSCSNNSKAADKLDGNLICLKSGAVESEAGDRVLEAAGIGEAAPGNDLPGESVELTAITLHQPWASLIAAGKKQYKTSSWGTDYRGSIAIHAAKKLHEDETLTNLLEIKASEIPLGAIVAIADLTDCILMDQEFILKQSSFEQYLGLWEVGRYAWKLENVRAIEPIQATGKQGLWKWLSDDAAFSVEREAALKRLTEGNGAQILSQINCRLRSLKIDNSDSWNPADFGEAEYKSEEDGQLNFLQVNEPPEPDDYGSIEQFDAAYKAWTEANSQQSTVNSQQSTVNSQEELCNTLMDGSICAAELAPASPMPESNCGNEALTTSVNGTATAETSLKQDSPESTELTTSESVILISAAPYSSSLLARLANPSALTESDSQQPIPETVSPMCSELSKQHDQTSQLLKTSPDSLTAPIPPAINQEVTSATSLTPYPRSGSMQNGKLLAALTLGVSGEGNGSLLLRSPGGLSGGENSRPPGKSRLETQLNQLGLIQDGEVVAPEFLELGYQLPIGYTNLQENRTALELSQVQAQQLQILHKSELLPAMETIETGEKPSATPLIGGLQQLDSSELNISQDLIESWTEWEKNNFLWLFEFDFCMHKGELKKIEKFLPGTKTIRLEGMQIGSVYLPMWEVEPPRFVENKSGALEISLPPNIGALEKAELISMAQEQHHLICVIERKEFELAIEKLHRVRLTGVYLQEFKKRCQYGEFENQLEQAGISPRSAQNYMAIAKNWEIVEAKTKLVSLLTEESQPAIGLKWALEAVRDEKKQLKSAAPPKDPDSWRTPNNNDQPVVSLVKKALGGQIWIDPCSDFGSSIPAAVRYHKNDDGLAAHNSWSKTVFINPPFSDPFPWVERCCLEIARGSVSAAVMLLKAGVVSNVGTGELINKYASALCYWRGRINFLNDEGNAVKGSDFDCVFVYFGARLDLFREAFGGRGTIATIENHYSSVNKKYLLKAEIPEFGNTQAEQKQLAAAVGLGNGRSVLPDRRDFDRELAERYDPHTVVDVLSMPTPPPVSENFAQPIGKPETFDETPLLTRQFETAKQNTLNDYITAISSNLSDFSNEQIAFLAKIINEESAKRIDF